MIEIGSGSEMEHRREAVNGYVGVISRLEPDLHVVDKLAALTSIAISLKRIADALAVGTVQGTPGAGCTYEE